MKHTSILVVDDEPRYIRLLRYNLESVGYRVQAAATGEAALAAASTEQPDLVILDIRLPGIDGFEVCRRLRESSQVPIIMLTAKGEEEDVVQGLHLGADDYVTKPFGAQELLARVEAVLRRGRLPDPRARQSTLSLGDLRIDFAQRRVTVRGQEIELSPTEYRLLYYLASNAGRVLVLEEILEKVWGPEHRERFDALRVCIHRLRQKIEANPDDPIYIVTQSGVGYVFAAGG